MNVKIFINLRGKQIIRRQLKGAIANLGPPLSSSRFVFFCVGGGGDVSDV